MHPLSLSRLAPMAVLLPALAACTTLDRDECLNADWRTIGYEDGVKGYPAGRIGEHRQACAPHGVKPDLAAYTAGREAGLRVFCQPANGYRYGRKGYAYGQVCPAALAGPFEEAYRYGRRIHVLDQDIARLTQRRHRLRGELEALREAIAAHEAELVAHGVTPARRAQLLEEIKALSAEAADLEHELDRVADARAAAREERDALLAQSPW